MINRNRNCGKQQMVKGMILDRLGQLQPGQKLTVMVAKMDGEGSADVTTFTRNHDQLAGPGKMIGDDKKPVDDQG